MTITLNLPEELVASLKSQAEREHVEIDAIAKRGIESVVEAKQPQSHSSMDSPLLYDESLLDHVSPRLRDTLLPIWRALKEANFIPPSDQEWKRLKEERLMKKYGPISSEGQD